jgi:hypothetical protein
MPAPAARRSLRDSSPRHTPVFPDWVWGVGPIVGLACSQIDIGNAATQLTDVFDKGTLRGDGSVEAEPRIDLRHVSDAILYMAGLPLDAGVQFIAAPRRGQSLIVDPEKCPRSTTGLSRKKDPPRAMRGIKKAPPKRGSCVM